MSNADRSIWQFPKNEADKVLGWRSDGKGMENKTLPTSIFDAVAAEVRDFLNVAPYVATRTALKALDTTKDTRSLFDGSLWVWTAGDYSAEVTADSQEGVYVKADAIATTSGAWIRSVQGDVLGTWFGMTADGSTDNWAAFTVAMTVATAFGRRLRVPGAADNYLLDLTTDKNFVLPANLRLYMESTANFEFIGTGTRFPFHADNLNTVVERFNFTVSEMDGGSLIPFLTGGGGSFRLESGVMDGGADGADGSLNWTVQLSKHQANEDFTSLYFGPIQASNMSRVWYRDNTDTGTIDKLHIDHTECKNFWAAPFATNSPSGTIRNVLVEGFDSEDNFARTISNPDTFHLGIGSADDVRIIAPNIRGAGNGIHGEEKINKAYIAGAQIHLTDADATGIFFSDNDVGGTAIAPKRIQIEGGSITGPGKATSTGHGINIANDASGVGGATDVSIIGVDVEGFERSIQIDDEYEAFNSDVAHCILRDGGTGFFSPFASRRVRLNQVINCDTPFSATDSGGVWGKENTVAFRYADFSASDTLSSKLPNWTNFVGSSPAANPVQFFGVGMRINSGAAANFPVSASQIVGPALFQTPAKGAAIFEARVQISDISSVGVFIGLTDQNGSLENPISIGAANAITTNASNAVGVIFDTAADTDNWWLVGVAGDVDATAQNAGLAPVNTTYETWRIEVEEGVARFFRNGNTQVGTAMTAAVATSAILYPVLSVYARSASTRYLQAEWVRVQSGP